MWRMLACSVIFCYWGFLYYCSTLHGDLNGMPCQIGWSKKVSVCEIAAAEALVTAKAPLRFEQTTTTTTTTMMTTMMTTNTTRTGRSAPLPIILPSPFILLLRTHMRTHPSMTKKTTTPFFFLTTRCMSFPLLLLLPPDLKDLILPLHLLDKEEEDVFVVVVLIRGVLCNGDDRFPPPPTSYDNDREFVFRIIVQHLSLII